jgi:hypothetical protein
MRAKSACLCHRGLTLMGMCRVIVPASLAVAAICLPASASVAAQNSPPYQPAWHLVYKTPNADAGIGLFSVTAPAKDDAWAVGTIGSKHATGYIVRWNGHHWRRVALPASGFQPWFVDSSAPDDVWVFGQDGKGEDTAYYRSAAGWQVVPQPPLTPTDQYPTGGLVVNAADVWLPAYPALHWNGQHWQAVTLPRHFVLNGFADVGGTIWAVGFRSGDGRSRVVVYRRRHGRWRWLPMPHPRGFTASIVTDGAHSVFVTVTNDMTSPAGSAVLYWNGRHWRKLPAPSAPPFASQPVGGFGADGLWLNTNLLWNGRQWLYTSQADGQPLVIDYGGIAQIPGIRSSWLATQICTGLKRGCQGEIWVAGKLPH